MPNTPERHDEVWKGELTSESSISRSSSPSPSSSASQTGKPSSRHLGSRSTSLSNHPTRSQSPHSLRDHLQSEKTYQNWIDDLPLPTPIHKVRQKVLTSAVVYLDRKLEGKENGEALSALVKQGLEAELRGLERVLERRQSEKETRNRLKEKSKGGLRRSRSLSPLPEALDEELMMLGGRGAPSSDSRDSGTASTLGLIDRSDTKKDRKNDRYRSTMSSDGGIVRRATGMPLRSKSSPEQVPKGQTTSKLSENNTKISRTPKNTKSSKYESNQIKDRKLDRSYTNPGSQIRNPNTPSSVSASPRLYDKSRSNSTSTFEDSRPPKFSLKKGVRSYVQGVVRWELKRQFDLESPPDSPHSSSPIRKSSHSQRRRGPRQSDRSAERTTDPAHRKRRHHSPVPSYPGSDIESAMGSRAPTQSRGQASGRLRKSDEDSDEHVREDVAGSGRATDRNKSKARSETVASTDMTLRTTEGRQTTEDGTLSSAHPSTGRATLAHRSAPAGRVAFAGDREQGED